MAAHESDRIMGPSEDAESLRVRAMVPAPGGTAPPSLSDETAPRPSGPGGRESCAKRGYGLLHGRGSRGGNGVLEAHALGLRLLAHRVADRAVERLAVVEALLLHLGLDEGGARGGELLDARLELAALGLLRVEVSLLLLERHRAHLGGEVLVGDLGEVEVLLGGLVDEVPRVRVEAAGLALGALRGGGGGGARGVLVLLALAHEAFLAGAAEREVGHVDLARE